MLKGERQTIRRERGEPWRVRVLIVVTQKCRIVLSPIMDNLSIVFQMGQRKVCKESSFKEFTKENSSRQEPANLSGAYSDSFKFCLVLLASVSVEEEQSVETQQSMRKQVTFCEEGMLTESLGASSWETEGITEVTIVL